jgi:hypothetical protein
MATFSSPHRNYTLILEDDTIISFAPFGTYTTEDEELIAKMEASPHFGKSFGYKPEPQLPPEKQAEMEALKEKVAELQSEVQKTKRVKIGPITTGDSPQPIK